MHVSCEAHSSSALQASTSSQQLASRLLELGVYVVGFFFPVVPKGQARIRVQMSAVHERHHLEAAVAAFAQAGRELGLLPLLGWLFKRNESDEFRIPRRD